jgi:hypothetical protein
MRVEQSVLFYLYEDEYQTVRGAVSLIKNILGGKI